jgi:predicted amidohydrolase
VRKVRVSSISFPGVAIGEKYKERAIASALEWIDRAALDKPDIICLPETFTGFPSVKEELVKTAEHVPGPTTNALAEKARQYSTYIVCPILERDGNRIFNSAILIDRSGNVIGKYHKIHPTIGEIELGVTPGREVKVFETEFGRIGFAICFDLNFRDVMDGLFERNTELVFFPSAYRGGLQLSIWAFNIHAYIVSATGGEQSAIVNPLGRVLAQSFVYGRIITKTINLDYSVLHIDYNFEKLDSVKKKYGPDVEFEFAAPEAVLLLTSHHPTASAKSIISEFGLEDRDQYFKRANTIRENALLHF